jgi:hypothetical protein
MRVVFLDHVARLSGADIGMLRLIAAADEVDAVVLLAEDGPLVAAVVHMPGCVRAVARRLRELDPDLVHTMSLKAGIYGTFRRPPREASRRMAPAPPAHRRLPTAAGRRPAARARAHAAQRPGAATFGEHAYERALRAQARALGIEDRVEFTGFVADIPGELQRLDLLVHASVLPEPLGLAVIEGMAAGVPVLAADAGGPAGTSRTAARDRDLRVSMSASGRRKAHAFAPEAVVGRMLALDRDVATRHRT